MSERKNSACTASMDGSEELFAFSMAFQPIVDVSRRLVYAYEALARGPKGEPAESVLKQVTPLNRYAFDQSCRIKAISLAVRLGMVKSGAKLSVNFIPGAVHSPAACIRHTLQASRESGFPMDRLVFEIAEDERIDNSAQLLDIVAEYRRHGLAIALDDFGAGYSGLNLLAELSADVLKLDGRLVRGIDHRPRAEEIVRSTVALSRRLRMDLVAESVETEAECATLQACGVTLMQGYLFAKPAFEALPKVTWVSMPHRKGAFALAKALIHSAA